MIGILVRLQSINCLVHVSFAIIKNGADGWAEAKKFGLFEKNIVRTASSVGYT